MFTDYSRMDRIPSNPLKALHIADLEDLYWKQVKKVKDRQREFQKAIQVTVITQ